MHRQGFVASRDVPGGALPSPRPAGMGRGGWVVLRMGCGVQGAMGRGAVWEWLSGGRSIAKAPMHATTGPAMLRPYIGTASGRHSCLRLEIASGESEAGYTRDRGESVGLAPISHVRPLPDHDERETWEGRAFCARVNDDAVIISASAGRSRRERHSMVSRLLDGRMVSRRRGHAPPKHVPVIMALRAVHRPYHG